MATPAHVPDLALRLGRSILHARAPEAKAMDNPTENFAAGNADVARAQLFARRNVTWKIRVEDDSAPWTPTAGLPPLTLGGANLLGGANNHRAPDGRACHTGGLRADDAHAGDCTDVGLRGQHFQTEIDRQSAADQ